MEHTQALDLFNSAISHKVTCTAAGCSYDPRLPVPQPHKASCKPEPCPPGYTCCFGYDTYACCGSDQKCDTGMCVSASKRLTL